MKVFARTSSREVTVTLVIWAVLVLAAITGLILLRKNTSRIIEQIHYVNVNRVAKANVLYAEAEKHATAALAKAEDLNVESEKKVVLPASDEHFQKAVSLFDEATELDQRPEFSPERRVYYEKQGQLYDAAGNREAQLLNHARAFMTQNNYEDARANIQAARDLPTSSVESAVLLAQLYNAEAKTTEALAVLNEAEQAGNLTPKGYWVRGLLNRNIGAGDLAIEDFRMAVEKDPKNLTYRLELGVSMQSSGKAEEASEILQSGLDDGGWLDAAYLHIYGDYLVEAGQFDEAIRILKQADQLAPFSGDVQWSLARAYHKAGEPRQAAYMLRRATEIKPDLQNEVF